MPVSITSISRIDAPWRTALVRAAIAYAISRLFVAMAAGIAISAEAVQDRLAGRVPSGGISALLNKLAMWDGHWYMEIARFGYPREIIASVTYDDPQARAAFFPVFPSLVRVFDVVLPGGPVWVGLTINLFVGGIFIVVLGVTARRFFDIATAEKTMIIAAMFPGSVVLSLAYSEAILLLLAAVCLLALTDKLWWAAGLSAALATATRPNGLALVVACAVASLVSIKQDRDWRSLVAPLLAPAGFVGFMIFLRLHAGEPWPWFRVQREAWDEGASFGATAAESVWKFITGPMSRPSSILTVSTLAAMGVALWAWRRYWLPVHYLAYSATVLFLMLMPATVTARPRFLFTAFPLIIPVGRLLRDEDERWWPLCVLLLGGGLVTVSAIYAVYGAVP